MKVRIKLLISILLISTSLLAQKTTDKTAFPESWLGNYKGKMFILTAKAGIVDSVDVEFLFQESGIRNRWTYKMTYHSIKYGEIVKDYELVKPDTLRKNSYLIDEKDGILILNALMGNTLYSNFIVAGSLLCSIMRKENEDIFFEISTSRDLPQLSTKNIVKGNEDSFIVDSYPPNTTQFVRFHKIYPDSNK